MWRFGLPFGCFVTFGSWCFGWPLPGQSSRLGPAADRGRLGLNTWNSINRLAAHRQR
jgi:hypothetical protein